MENFDEQLLYLKDTKKVHDELVSIFEEHSRLTMILTKDVAICGLSVYDNSETQFWRRTVLRSFIASIEGIIYSAKNMSLKMAEFLNIELSEAEITLLREQNYQINDNGDPKTTDAKLRTVGNFMFTLKMCSKASQAPEIRVDKRGIAWRNFLETIKLRHRITHPKSCEKLNISDQEFRILESTVEWFGDINKGIIGTIEYAIKCKQKELNALTDSLTRQ